jgi:hypothetical protein
MARVNCGGVSRLELRGPLLQDASTGCSPPPCAADRERAAAAVPGVIACRHVLQGLVRGEHLIPRTSTTMKRNPDRTWRNARHAIVVGNRIIVARWVTVEILRCKRTGLSMAAIAVHIGRVGQGYEHCLPFPTASSSLSITASAKVRFSRLITRRRRTGNLRSMPRYSARKIRLAAKRCT